MSNHFSLSKLGILISSFPVTSHHTTRTWSADPLLPRQSLAMQYSHNICVPAAPSLPFHSSIYFNPYCSYYQYVTMATRAFRKVIEYLIPASYVIRSKAAGRCWAVRKLLVHCSTLSK
ncbi:hypothetical protein J6590_008640 [Homalodisca vitripennis]|nr:hypothetical protein J6590_008640 [Homalodisca vitripennis]